MNLFRRAKKADAPKGCLTPQQTERFYSIWRRLLRYGNRRLQSVEAFLLNDVDREPMNAEQAMEIRNALWADDALLDDYVRENPDGLAQPDRTLVESWKRRVQGTFVILRVSKDHALFLHSIEDEEVVYGVKGLQSPIDETCPFIPCYIEAVLLPFDDCIIYDGLFTSYNLMLGRNITADLKRTSRAAEERGAVITSLQPIKIAPDELKRNVRKAHGQVLQEFRRQLAASSLSMKVIERDLEHVERLLDSMTNRTPAHRVHDLSWQDIEADLQLSYAFLTCVEYKQVLTSFKRFVKFLRNSERLDWRVADELLDELKMFSN